MKRPVAAALLISLLGAGTAGAQLKPKIKEMRQSPRVYLNEVVEIDGYVTQFAEDEATSTRFYFLKDDWGGLLRVRTSHEFPEVGRRYKVSGVLGEDPRLRDLYLSEDSRVSLDGGGLIGGTPASGALGPAVAPPLASAVPAPAASTPALEGLDAEEPAPWYEDTGLLALVVILALVLLGIVIALVVILARRKRTRPRTRDFTMAAAVAAEPAPPPQQLIEGRTIKMHAPPPGTLKILPGWFEVLAGDETVREIRFYRLKGEATAATTFGRATGRPYVHIQLKPMTVSSRQAQVAFEGSSAKLTNFAPSDSNPTRVNGRELGADEAVALNEGDKVEMGEVTFKYHTT